MPGSIQDESMDVLKNLETAIAGVYREHPELADYQVDAALESLGSTYARQASGREPVLPKSPLAIEVYKAVKLVCDWQLGREHPVDEEGQPLDIEPISVDELLAVLKRLRKSVQFWNKESGSQGYLNYVIRFIS